MESSVKLFDSIKLYFVKYSGLENICFKLAVNLHKWKGEYKLDTVDIEKRCI